MKKILIVISCLLGTLLLSNRYAFTETLTQEQIQKGEELCSQKNAKMCDTLGLLYANGLGIK